MGFHTQEDQEFDKAFGFMKGDRKEMNQIVRQMSPGGKYYHSPEESITHVVTKTGESKNKINHHPVLTDDEILKKAKKHTVYGGPSAGRQLWPSSKSSSKPLTLGLVLLVIISLLFLLKKSKYWNRLLNLKKSKSKSKRK